MIVLTRRPDQPTSPDYRLERGRATIDWPLWSTTARLVVTDPAALGAAKDLADGVLDEVAAAGDRFDPAAEIHRVEAAQGAPVVVSAVLADLLAVAVAAASFTNGDVDPTLGSALRALGYDRDLDDILWSGDSVHVVRQPAGWEDIHLDGDLGIRCPAPGSAIRWSALSFVSTPSVRSTPAPCWRCACCPVSDPAGRTPVRPCCRIGRCRLLCWLFCSSRRVGGLHGSTSMVGSPRRPSLTEQRAAPCASSRAATARSVQASISGPE